MNDDDETFLSAYLDGELSPGQQQRLESALPADADLAERLRTLAVVRDLVASLPRDRCVDVSARVMQQIHTRSGKNGIRPTLEGWRRGSRRVLPLAGLAASAASLMVAASLAILVQTRQIERSGQSRDLARGDADIVASNRTSASVVRPVFEKAAELPAVSSPSRPGDLAADVKAVAAAPSAVAIASERVAADAHISRLLPSADAEHVRQFLDSPGLKRIFWVESGRRRDCETLVSSVVERTTPFDFFKLSLAEGILLDSRHREEATIIAFVASPALLERFHAQIAEALPGLVHQDDALDPAVVTQLAEIDRIQSFPPAPVSEVEIPREALALRTRPAGGEDRLHGEQEGPAAGVAESDQKIVVLVWVAKPSGR